MTSARAWSRSELLYQPPPMSIELPETITIHDEPLKTTESLTYLGRRLQTWKWKGGSNPPGRPMVRYKRDPGAVMTSAQKNQSEGLLSCSHPLPALFHRGHHSLPQAHCGSDKSPASPPTLSDILNIKWQDRIPGVEVLRRAHTVSVEALITVSQLRRWAGLVRRMANSRLPKAVFYSELRQGKRSHGG